MSKKISLLMLALLLSMISCSAETNITDMCGREISVADPVERIVVLSAADCEMLYAIGAGDAVIARGEYCDYPEDVLSVPSVTSGYETSIEQILALEPQLVIMTKMGQTVEQVNAIANAGIPVFVSDAQSIDGIYENITLLGAITGKQDEANAAVASMREEFEKITAENTGKTVYFEVSPLEWGLWTSGQGTFLDEIAALTGTTNIFGELEGWASVSEEQVIDRNPDFIVTTTEMSGGLSGDEEIAARPAWTGITAVKNGKILLADYNTFTRPGPRLVEAAKLFAAFVSD